MDASTAGLLGLRVTPEDKLMALDLPQYPGTGHAPGGPPLHEHVASPERFDAVPAVRGPRSP
jgi:hypothetical protein